MAALYLDGLLASDTSGGQGLGFLSDLAILLLNRIAYEPQGCNSACGPSSYAARTKRMYPGRETYTNRGLVHPGNVGARVALDAIYVRFARLTPQHYRYVISGFIKQSSGPMNVLSQQKRALIVQLLCEGNSMRGIVRLTGVCRQTISTLILDLGAACEWYMDWKHRGLECKRVQVDEVWSFLKQKEQRLEEKGQVDRGDIWSFLSFDPDSKLLISIMTGKRTAEMASRFMEDLERRVTGRFHLTTDQFRSYKDAVKDGFRHRNMDYSQVLKLMAAGGQSRGESAQIIGNGEGKPRVSGKPWRRPYVAGVEVRDVLGEPDMARSSTAGVERVNLTLRMSNRRFARSTNAHSKSLPHHVAMLAIFGVHYNYVRRHASLSKTPAQEAGLSAKRWTMLDLVSIMNLASAQDTAEVRRLDPSEGNL